MSPEESKVLWAAIVRTNVVGVLLAISGLLNAIAIGLLTWRVLHP